MYDIPGGGGGEGGGGGITRQQPFLIMTSMANLYLRSVMRKACDVRLTSTLLFTNRICKITQNIRIFFFIET